MTDRRSKEVIEREAAIVQAQLKVLRAREAEFQRILDDMQRLKDSVASERQELEARQKELDSETQPIHWLPAELLIQIFLHATAMDSTDMELYHHTPVAISHVSSKWRSIALGTSQMWSKVSCAQGVVWNSRPLVAFLSRSKQAPLDVTFIPTAALTHQDENRRSERFFIHLTPHIGRICILTLQSHGPEAMQRLVSLLALPISEFSSLRALNLSISSIGPSALSSPSLLPSKLQDSVSGSAMTKLTCLRLDQLPLFNIPKYFLSNLTTLELAFPSKKSSSEGPNCYMLRLSQLLQFLGCTPKLEELVLSNTVPFVDAYVSESTIINLVHLRSLEWSYPFRTDIHYFLAFLNIPSLERFDISVDEFPAQRSNIMLLRNYPESGPPSPFFGNRAISLSSIRDLSLQCLHEDTIGCVLRKFTFPVLETLELTHVATRGKLPVLPRLESMFRDPRLPLLKHLTLCHFSVSPELGKTEALLGYMPALETLTLDACMGVGTLLQGLQHASGGGQPRMCPRLEAITLWRCADVTVSDLVGVVIARNGGSDHGRRAGGAGGSGSRSSAGLSRAETAETSAGSGVGTGRTIRPLKKLRRQGGEAAVLAQNTSQGQLIAAAMAVASCPATRVSYVRVEGCALIEKEEVEVLKSLGVTDVFWRED
ncbi:hypothetical protein FB45DRAFT_1092164 [Roridomyces roridus]|uniref:F-box domain-containing protein n=1 Tax=Roridomyces roridus TaxID=1738132 RepID=A0AAD7BH79_9AGAR|nr:hypothetical protein FB45DRAFT_1092164 [Roridomyces roridus]